MIIPPDDAPKRESDGKAIIPLPVALAFASISLTQMSEHLIEAVLAPAFGDNPEEARPILEKLCDIVDTISARCGQPAGEGLRKAAVSAMIEALDRCFKNGHCDVVWAPLESAVDEWPEELNHE